MATISQADWMRMVTALGPAKAEAWRQQQGVEVGDEDTPAAPLSDGGTDEVDAVGGALSAPDSAPDERATILKQLQELQQRDMKGFGDEREYRRKLFEEGRAALEKERMGPSRTEQLFALAAAFSQPQRYKGFGGMMANVMPVMAEMTSATRQADRTRSEALRRLEREYMSDEQSLSRGERGSRRQYLTAMLAATKPEKPQLVWSERFGRFIPKDELTVIQGGSLNGKRTEKLSDGTVRIYEADGTFNLYDAGGRLVGSGGSPTGASGGPTQPASGGFRR